jgi:hypothetical protein
MKEPPSAARGSRGLLLFLFVVLLLGYMTLPNLLSPFGLAYLAALIIYGAWLLFRKKPAARGSPE